LLRILKERKQTAQMRDDRVPILNELAVLARNPVLGTQRRFHTRDSRAQGCRISLAKRDLDACRLGI